ncbi:MAG: glycoside hydrolase family 3 C-terminal domain-containing protein [Lachnospiraceae bacterium]|nr:glycoside hydrolase family 3 C-terminal domain-containing protein [Lachnospiraceae bacterium]
MKKKILKTFSLLIVLSLVLAGCSKSDPKPENSDVNTGKENEQPTSEPKDNTEEGKTDVSGTPTATPDPDAGKTAVEIMLSKMSLTEKIEQMIMPAIRAWGEVDKEEPLTKAPHQIIQYLNNHKFCGIILFAQNITDTEQTVRLIDSLQAANAVGGRTGLFIALDQEGGVITRLSMGTKMCGNMALGASGSEELTKKAAELIGKECMALGFNTDFAPVLDVNNNPANPIIGVRSFSDDPELVGKLGIAYVDGLASTGVITTVKHFPGHGDTATDSHTGLPCIDKSLEDLEKLEFIPYKAVADHDVDMIMTAHIQFPQIEKNTYKSISDGTEINLPATLSHEIITGVLREKMDYDGVIVTDALEMDAIDKHFNKLDAAKLAINAGVDILLIPFDINNDLDIRDSEKYIQGIADMVTKGEISEETINDSVMRILKLKEKRGLLEPINPIGTETYEKVEAALQFVGSKENHEIESEITKETITLVKNDDDVLPLKADDKKKIKLVCTYNSQLKSLEYAVRILKEKGVIPEDADVSCGSFDEIKTEDAVGMVEGADYVVAVSILSNQKQLNPVDANGDGTPDETNYAACIDAMMENVHSNGGKFILISSRLPYDIARYMDAEAAIACYNSIGMTQDPGDFSTSVPGYGPNIIEAVYAVFGLTNPSGKLPVNVYGVDENYKFTDEVVYKRGTGFSYK